MRLQYLHIKYMCSVKWEGIRINYHKNAQNISALQSFFLFVSFSKFQFLVLFLLCSQTKRLIIHIAKMFVIRL